MRSSPHAQSAAAHALKIAPPPSTTDRRTGVIAALVAAALAVGAGAALTTEAQYFQTTPLPFGRQAHGAGVIGDVLYVVGGALRQGEITANTTSTSFARINADGSLGSWTETTPLPQPLLYIGNSTVVRGPIIYVAGGNINDGHGLNVASRVVHMAAQMRGGVLSNWVLSDPFPGPGLQAGAAVGTRSHLYVIGGADDGNNPQPIVYSAPFIEGGLLGPWTRQPDLPQGVWFNMAGISRNRVYVWGGTTTQNQSGTVDTTVMAEIRPDGSLGQWRRLAPLPTPLYFSGSASLDEMLFNFAGRFPDGNYTSDVLFAIPNAAGELDWTRVRANVPLTRYLAPAVDTRRGIIYLPGGRSQDTLSMPEVFGYRVPRPEQMEVAEVFHSSAQTTEPTAIPEPPPAPEPTPRAPLPPPPAPASAGTRPPLGDPWVHYAEGERQAVATGRNMLLYFTTAHARLGRTVEREIFGAAQFAAVAQSHVCVYVDAAVQRDLAITYGIYRVPTVVITDPSGQPLRSYVRDFTLNDLLAAP